MSHGKSPVPFAFVSVTQPSGDDPGRYRRMVVYWDDDLEAGQRIHKWISFNLGRPHDMRRSAQISTIAALENADKKGPEKNYFKDRFTHFLHEDQSIRRDEPSDKLPLNYLKKPEPAPIVLDSSKKSAGCISCHVKEGPLLIYPTPVPVTPLMNFIFNEPDPVDLTLPVLDPRDVEALKKINQSMIDRPTAVSPLDVNQDLFGKIPALDLKSHIAIPDSVFLEHPYYPASSAFMVTLPQVKRALTCGKCHDGSSEAYVRPGGTTGAIISGAMPKENHLSPEERQNLASVFSQYFYSINAGKVAGKDKIHRGLLYYILTQESCAEEGGAKPNSGEASEAH